MKTPIILVLITALTCGCWRSQKPEGPYFATGIKIGEVTDHQAIVWARLTRNAERLSDSAPIPVILYRNPVSGLFGPKPDHESRPDLEPKVEYPAGTNIHTIAGAVPGAPGEVRFLWRSGGNAWNESPWQTVNTQHDFTTQYILDDLTPGTHYELRVEARPPDCRPVSDTLSGSFETAPAPDVSADVRFMAVTGQAYPDRDDGSNGFKIYKAMLAQNPDFFVHTGDIVYYDQYAKNVALARWHWQRMYSFPDLVAFHRKVDSYFEKDDHDTWMNDCWPTMRTRFMGDFTFEEGQQIFLDEVPMSTRTYRTYRWGKDLQVWLVEGRDNRVSNDMPDGPGKTIWGEEQLEWFENTVDTSTATFRILISPTPIVGPDRPQKDDNYANSGFGYEGQKIRDFIARHPRMYVVTGDRHWQYVSKDDKTGILEFSTGPESDQHAGGWKQGDKRPEHLYLNVVGGYLEVYVFHKDKKPEIVFRHHDVDGKILFEYNPEEDEGRRKTN